MFDHWSKYFDLFQSVPRLVNFFWITGQSIMSTGHIFYHAHATGCLVDLAIRHALLRLRHPLSASPPPPFHYYYDDADHDAVAKPESRLLPLVVLLLLLLLQRLLQNLLQKLLQRLLLLPPPRCRRFRCCFLPPYPSFSRASSAPAMATACLLFNLSICPPFPPPPPPAPTPHPPAPGRSTISAGSCPTSRDLSRNPRDMSRDRT